MQRVLLLGVPSRPRRFGWLLAASTSLAASGCAPHAPAPPVVTTLPPLPASPYDAGVAAPRLNGPLAQESSEPQVAESTGYGALPRSVPAAGGAGAGSISLAFDDTDIREVAAQILGNTLHVSYTIDPAVHGTATLRTVTPLAETQLIPVLEALLAQNGGVYRVLPAASAVGMAGGLGTSGGMMVPLRYAGADDLAKVLAPYAQGGARVVAVPSANALIIAGEPAQRDALIDLVSSFDIDVLAGQSYALFPVTDGSAADFATALQGAMRAAQGGQLANQIHILPLDRVNAVLVVASAPRYIQDARQLYSVVERGRRQSARSWHVYYIQNSTANDIAYILQQAFTPDNVTAQPTSRGTGTPSSNQGGLSGMSSSLSGGSSGASGSGLSGGSTGSGSGTGGLGSGLSALGGGGSSNSGAEGTPTRASTGSQTNPLLGGLSNSGGEGGGGSNEMRIIPNPENNALLVYATGEEESTVESMLHKIDILPLQVRIDAVIAEVTLTDQLAYGTEFYFKHHDINGGTTGSAIADATQFISSVADASPSFVFNAASKDGDIVLNALQAITKVKVLSAPDLLVLDNETAQLEVGNLVPYQTGSVSTPTTTAGLAVENSTAYQQTGIITQVTPRVNSGGLVTLDIAQEVSGVSPDSGTAASGSSINSPTFTDRSVKSRVVVQDGQTIALAGLITDNDQRGNSGLPFFKDIPVLGFLGGTQSNSGTRTELLVLLTPHVMHDQREAHALTEDLREALPNAAMVPYDLGTRRPGSAVDPNAALRHRLGLSE